MNKDNFAGVSPEIQELILPLMVQIENLQQQLNNTVAAKDAEIAHLKEVIETYQRMLFGSKSEKTRYLSQMDQMSLFHEDTAPENAVEKKTTVVKEHKRDVQSKQNRDDYIKLMIESGRFPVETVLYDVPETERFDSTGKPLEKLGVEHVRYELNVVPKKYIIKDILVASYGSKRSKETEGTRAEIVEGDVPPAIIPHSPAGASVLADVAINKCDYGLPLYRQERILRDMGVPIRRNVLAGWFISTADLIHPLWDAMKEATKKLSTINADETFGQVLHNATGNPRAQLDYWAYCSGKWEPIQVACFEYCSSRREKCQEISGWIHR